MTYALKHLHSCALVLYRSTALLRYCFAALVLLCSCALVLYGGGRPGAFLSWGAGARHMALGNTAVGITEDAFSPYYNSASLGFIERKELGTFHAMLWEDTSYSYVGYVHPLLDKGALGFNLIRLHSGAAVMTDENNRQVGDFSFQQLAFGAGYGRTVYKNLSLGAIGRLFNTSLHNASNNNFTVDAGLTLKVNDVLSIGANFQNIFALTMGETSDELPIVFRIGGGYRIFDDRLKLSLDVGRNGGEHLIDYHSMGLESRLNEFFALRLGRNPQEITGGFGLSFKNFNLDYALALHYLGFSHRASFNFRFGRPTAELREILKKSAAAVKPLETGVVPGVEAAAEERMQLFQENYQGAINMYRRGLFMIALDRFKNAADIDPDDPEVPIFIERLNMITPIVPQNMATDRISELMRRGIVYFIEGHGRSAAMTLAYAYSLEPDNFTLMRLLGRVEEKTGHKIDRSRPASGLTIVDQKHYESLIAFRKRDYAHTIRLCEEILLLEPNDTLALKRLGSAFFAMGERDKAKRMWERALEIEPNPRIERLIRQIK